jgi:hypothetical protein
MEAQSQNHAYTILRIKRKRTEEPLDALGMHLATRGGHRATLVQPGRLAHAALTRSRRIAIQEEKITRWCRRVPVRPDGRARCLGRRRDKAESSGEVDECALSSCAMLMLDSPLRVVSDLEVGSGLE